jgi:hypothetical protein
VSRGPSTCPAVLARCAESASLRMHTHGLRPDMHDTYFLKPSMQSWNGSGRGSRHPAPPRMKKRRAEPPRDQPRANSHASYSPAERRQEMAGARPAAMTELCLLYVPMSRSRRRPQEMAGGARPAAMAEHSPSLRSRRGDASHASPCLDERRRRRELGRSPCSSAHGARVRGGVYRASPCPAEQRQ